MAEFKRGCTMRIITTNIFAALIIAILLGPLFGHEAPGGSHKTNPTCEPYDKQRAILESEEWKEAPVGRGISTDGLMIELYRSKDGGTFTMIYSYPDGTSCVLRAGFKWHDIEWKDPRGKTL